MKKSKKINFNNWDNYNDYTSDFYGYKHFYNFLIENNALYNFISSFNKATENWKKINWKNYKYISVRDKKTYSIIDYLNNTSQYLYIDYLYDWESDDKYNYWDNLQELWYDYYEKQLKIGKE